MNERVLLEMLLLRRIKKKALQLRISQKRRWAIRPVLRQRKTIGEYYTTFLLYKEIDADWFFLYTRMTSDQFDECLSYVGPLLQKNSHREPICAAQRLAMTLRYLAQGDSLFSIASGYKIGRSTASVIIRETTEAIWTSLANVVLKPLTSAELKSKADEFLRRWNFPHDVGAIDGKHISIIQPFNSGSDFFNYKKHFSIVLLAVCDAHCNFTYVDIGAYGSQSDGGVFANCTLGKAIAKGDLLLPEDEMLNKSKIKMPYFFVGDDAFSLQPHLFKPYKGNKLNTVQAIFNYRLSRARRVIENAFGILVARWRVFTGTIATGNADTVDSIVKATVCLHNFLKQREYALPDRHRRYCPNSFVDRETDNGIVLGNWRLQQDSLNVILRDIPCDYQAERNPSRMALRLRDQFAQYLISPSGALAG